MTSSHMVNGGLESGQWTEWRVMKNDEKLEERVDFADGLLPTLLASVSHRLLPRQANVEGTTCRREGEFSALYTLCVLLCVLI